MNKILLIVNFQKNIEPDFILRLKYKMLKAGAEIYILRDSETMFSEMNLLKNVHVLMDMKSFSEIDLVVVLGGDGSIIKVASDFCEAGIPILGINFGRIGYLAELEASDIDSLDGILSGSYNSDERMMLDIKIERASGDCSFYTHALNDAVLTNGPIAKLLTFDIMCNDIKLQTFRADGVIVSTPTGSTAYSMSAGGPVLDPSLDAVCLTPICSHTLNNRSVVVRGDSKIELKNIKSVHNSIYLTIDGRTAEKISENDRILITKSKVVTKLIRVKNNGFLEVLKNKLSEN